MLYTELNQELQSKLHINFNDPIKEEWIRYIQQSHSNRNPLSKTNLYRLALTEQMHKLKLEGRTLFHVSITYKSIATRTYSEKDINTFFINFYTKNFLPYLIKTKNYGRPSKKLIQPMSYVFVDEHEMTAIKTPIFNSKTFNVEFDYVFPTRLHHHAIMALHPSTLEQMKSLEGTNTLNNSDFSSIFMTSDVRECDAQCLLYASKMLHRYPDFMMFPS